MSVKFDPSDNTHYAAAKRRDGKAEPYVRYRYDSTPLPMAVNAALTTSRPLLLRGEPGSGKSTLAYDVAMGLGWKYFERVISSRMSANDLLWHFDAVLRLSDGQVGKAMDVARYIRPQPLWQALDPGSAAQYEENPDRHGDFYPGAVILLDEIDKADPDLPNDLLVVLGEGRFRVAELGDRGEITARRENILIVVTTNGERELPAAFLRRCVCVRLETPGAKELEAIALSHMPDLQGNPYLAGWIQRMLEIRSACKSDQHKPGTAEILDAIRACRDLGVNDATHKDWVALTLAMGWKNPERPPELKQSTKS